MEQSDRDPIESSHGERTETPLTMITARNKLKQVEDKIYEARHRLDILNQKNQKNQFRNMNKTRAEGLRGNIREFASREKQIKKQTEMRRSLQMTNWHEINMDRRAEHRQKMNQMREMMRTQNRWVYQQIKKQRQKNQKSISKEKSKQQQLKKKRREQLQAEQQRRSAYLKQYLKNKHLQARYAKQQETSQIQAQITQRQKLLQNLERKGSQLSMNPETSQRSRINQNNESRLSKGFRISSNKKKQVGNQ